MRSTPRPPVACFTAASPSHRARHAPLRRPDRCPNRSLLAAPARRNFLSFGEGSLPGSAQGSRRLGELPRHDDRPGGGVGLAEHRPEGGPSGTHHLRALCDGLARHLLRRVGERPEDYAPAEYPWGYNRMMTVDGLFGADDTIGGTAHKFSSGSFTEGRIAAKAAVKYVMEKGRDQPQVSEKEVRDLQQEIYQPLENYRIGRNEIVAGTVSPSYLLPIHGLQRLEKIMDEYVGGISTN